MKRALITGGQQGIGLGIARALHGAGFEIALTAELPPDAGPVQAALAELPGARYVQHDLAKVDGVAATPAHSGFPTAAPPEPPPLTRRPR